MSTVLRRNRKGSDAEILRLNRLGLSLANIGRRLNCDPSSLTQRLKSLKVPPTDTRRAFMEDILANLSPDHEITLADRLEAEGISIKDYVRSLILQDLAASETSLPTT